MKWLLYYYFKSLGGPSDKRVQFSFIQYKHSTVYELCATVADADNGHNKVLGDKVLVTDWHLYSKRDQKKKVSVLSPTFLFSSTSYLFNNYLFILYIPKARTVLLACFASDQVHQALNILLIKSNKQKGRSVKWHFLFAFILWWVSFKCAQLTNQQMIYSTLYLWNCLCDNPEELFHSFHLFTLFLITKASQDRFFFKAAPP